MIRTHFIAVALAVGLAGCGNQQAATSNTATAAAAAVAGPADSADAGSAGGTLQGVVLRYAPGGRPDAFCTPDWSIANQTSTDIPGLLIQIAWHRQDGQVLQEVGEFGTLQEDLSAGRRVDRSLVGHPVPCNELKIVVGRYACRDGNAVRMACPGPLHVLTDGGIEADVSGLEEGTMRGVMEP